MFDLSLPQLICPLAIWATLVCFFTSICFALREGIIKLQKLHRIPCSRCAFSTGDYRLKCTVRPCQAFTEEAIYCLDFEERQYFRWRRRIKQLATPLFKSLLLLFLLLRDNIVNKLP